MSGARLPSIILQLESAGAAVRVPKWVVRLLILALVPVLVFTTQDFASASGTTAYGTPQTATWHSEDQVTSSDKEGGYVDCSVTGYWVTAPLVGFTGTTSYIKYTGSCKTGWNISSAVMHFTVGGACDETSDTHQVDGNASFSGDTSPGEVVTNTSGVPPNCPVTQLCYEMDVKAHTNPFSTMNWDGCVAWPLGQPPAVGSINDGVCSLAHVQQPTVGYRSSVNNGASRLQGWVDFTGTVAPDVSGGGGGKWIVYEIWGPGDVFDPDATDTTAGMIRQWGNPNATTGMYGLGGAVFGGATASGVVSGLTALTLSGSGHTSGLHFLSKPAGKYGRLMGVGIAQINGAGQSAYFPTSTAQLKVNDNATSTFYGVNDPGRCQFYWGEKAWDLAGTLVDEPAGPFLDNNNPPTDPNPVTPVPPDAGSSCAGFSFTDPSSWASAGICAINRILGVIAGILSTMLGVLNGILSALAGLGASIASAVVGALSGLFVPSDGFYEDQVNGVEDAWSGTAPWTLWDGVGSVASALSFSNVSSSCTGPALSFDNPVTHGGQTVHPFDACSGGAATLATVTRTALQIGVWVAAAILAFRILAASVGVQIHLRAGDE